ncbi:MAG: hypothetical protein ACFFBD_00830 [Candidatus Hodarchaeota archaeon]
MYRNWYRVLLINPQSQFHERRFFTELEPVFEEFQPHLQGLLASTGHPLTEVVFQLRWFVWWKIFAPRPLQRALKVFKESDFSKMKISEKKIFDI